MGFSILHIFRSLAIPSLALGVASSGVQAGPENGFQAPSAFIRQVREAMRVDDEIQKKFTYRERRRDVKISRLGKVTIGPQRTFEVYPPDERGQTYKRLIAVNGKPLDPAELARRDEEHRRHLEERAAREKQETPSERAERLEKLAEEERERKAIVDDAFAVFEPKFVGRETISGDTVVVAELHPRKHARVTTREGAWMKHFTGRIWVSEADYQIARLDMHAFEDITIGWGIVGRIHAGSRLIYTRRKVNGIWLPDELMYDASGRTLLFRKFEFKTVTSYFDHKRTSSQ